MGLAGPWYINLKKLAFTHKYQLTYICSISKNDQLNMAYSKTVAWCEEEESFTELTFVICHVIHYFNRLKEKNHGIWAVTEKSVYKTRLSLCVNLKTKNKESFFHLVKKSCQKPIAVPGLRGWSKHVFVSILKNK